MHNKRAITKSCSRCLFLAQETGGVSVVIGLHSNQDFSPSCATYRHSSVYALCETLEKAQGIMEMSTIASPVHAATIRDCCIRAFTTLAI